VAQEQEEGTDGQRGDQAGRSEARLLRLAVGKPASHGLAGACTNPQARAKSLPGTVAAIPIASAIL